jgi:predicted RNA binding protein YcfA (HicA-like mRNA interferase family)
MGKKQKLYNKLLKSPKNIRFEDFLVLLAAFGFILDRIRGSHHVFKHYKVADALLSVQPDKDGKAKPYQLRQFLALIEEYDLKMVNDEDNEGDGE